LLTVLPAALEAGQRDGSSHRQLLIVLPAFPDAGQRDGNVNRHGAAGGQAAPQAELSSTYLLPPGVSYRLESVSRQVQELEVRLSVLPPVCICMGLRNTCKTRSSLFSLLIACVSVGESLVACTSSQTIVL
jgi:hypothetical protein